MQVLGGAAVSVAAGAVVLALVLVAVMVPVIPRLARATVLAPWAPDVILPSRHPEASIAPTTRPPSSRTRRRETLIPQAG